MRTNYTKMLGDVSRFNERHAKTTRNRVHAVSEIAPEIKKLLNEVVGIDDLLVAQRNALGDALKNAALSGSTIDVLMEQYRAVAKRQALADKALLAAVDQWLEQNKGTEISQKVLANFDAHGALVDYLYTVEKDEEDRDYFESEVRRYNRDNPHKQIEMEKREVGCCAVYRVPVAAFVAAGFELNPRKFTFGSKDWWPLGSLQSESGWEVAHRAEAPPAADEDEYD